MYGIYCVYYIYGIYYYLWHILCAAHLGQVIPRLLVITFDHPSEYKSLTVPAATLVQLTQCDNLWDIEK